MEKAIIKDSLILININLTYEEDIKPEEIYEATRKAWKVDLNHVSKVEIACSVFRGIIREVFIIDRWLPSPEEGRHMFEGKVAPENIREKYINKSVAKYWKKGCRYPIRYVNV